MADMTVEQALNPGPEATIDDLMAAWEVLADEVRKHQWIPMEAGAPEKAGRYLVASEYDATNVARYLPRSGTWKFASAKQAFVPAFWKPLPAPPKEEA